MENIEDRSEPVNSFIRGKRQLLIVTLLLYEPIDPERVRHITIAASAPPFADIGVHCLRVILCLASGYYQRHLFKIVVIFQAGDEIILEAGIQNLFYPCASERICSILKIEDPDVEAVLHTSGMIRISLALKSISMTPGRYAQAITGLE